MALLNENADLNLLLLNAPGNFLIWNRFLTQLTLQLNCDSSVLLITDLNKRKNTHFLFNSNITQDYQQRYENELNRLDIFNYFISKNPQQVFFNQNSEDIHDKTIKGKFIQPDGQEYRFGVSIPCNHNHSLNLLVNRKKIFDDIEVHKIRQCLQRIIPSLKSAMLEEQRLKINSQLFYFTGVHFDEYIIVDQELNVLFTNPDYTSFVNQLDCVAISGNRLTIKNPVIKQQLLSMIESNRKTESIHNQCHSCKITLIPISSLDHLYQWECYKDGFILTFTHENKKNDTIERLEEIYQLSKCEAVCALHFIKTPSINDIALKTYRSQETIRNHLKHTMQKMHVHSQAELMKKLITLPALSYCRISQIF